MPFCFVSCDIKTLISRKNFFVALTCLAGPPAQRYRSLNEYSLEHCLDWGKCVGVCTDGAANVTACRSGVMEKMKEVAHEEMLATHCIIHV